MILKINSVNLDLYEDDDEFPNEEVLAIEDFSKVIRSLLENNKELNRFFCDMTRRIYDPENENIHNLPQTLFCPTNLDNTKFTYSSNHSTS